MIRILANDSCFIRRCFVTGMFVICLLGINGVPVAKASKGAFARQEDDVRNVPRLESQGEYEKVVELLNEAIAASPETAEYYYWRGRSLFCLAQVEDSISDFDRYIELSPSAASRQWERGIALYYAGRFKEGAEQFELYQSYHDNDVENSTWRFLCVAREDDLETAVETLLPIRNDRRIPMMEIFALYGGEMTPDEVLEAADQADRESDRHRQAFYANLYVGLYLEAQGEHERARVHLEKAQQTKIAHYMWNVADIHIKLLDQVNNDQSDDD